jgi:hypothetical protein
LGVLPPDNFLGPASGKMTVYENLKKLSYDLTRAEERARHTQAVQDDMARKHRIYAENVQRVRGMPTYMQLSRCSLLFVDQFVLSKEVLSPGDMQ